jgi:periplasmic mercuric ion binding protein
MDLRRSIVKKLSILLVALALGSPLHAATKTAAFEVSGWTCGSCAAATRIALKKLDGVEDVKTDNENKEALVTYDDSKVTTDRMVQAIAKLGYKAALKNGASAASSPRSPGSAAPIAAKETSPPAEHVSFFEVPLECGAAEGLGCGSAAKPILSELDRNSRIAQARINHPGTILAVVWKSQNDRSDSAVEALFEKHKLAAASLKGQAREKALKEFQSAQWYGAADVDRLSEHEARVIAARLVNRARARLDIPPNRLAALTEDLALVFARHLTLSDEECDTRRDVIEAELVKAASKYLNPQQQAELRKAGEQGIQALPGEDE